MEMTHGQESTAVEAVLALFLAGWPHLGWLDLVGRPARSSRARGDQIGDGEYASLGSPPARLIALLARKPSSDEAAYLLGICEQRRGRNEAAAEAWARVAPGSEFCARRRSRLACVSPKTAGDSPTPSDSSTKRPKTHAMTAPSLRAMLVPLYSQLGRVDEAERLVENRWEHLNATGEGASERAIFPAPATHRSYPQAQLGREHPRLSRPCRQARPRR